MVLGTATEAQQPLATEDSPSSQLKEEPVSFYFPHAVIEPWIFISSEQGDKKKEKKRLGFCVPL